MEAHIITDVIDRGGAASRGENSPRARVIEAVWAVIAQTGAGHASLRNIAAAMQATTGLVTRHFPDKHSLLLASLRRATATLIAAAHNAGAGQQGLDQAQAILQAALPGRPGVQRAWRVWIAFLGELPGNADLAAAHKEWPGELRRMLIAGLREAQRREQIKAQLYSPLIADALVNQLVAVAVRQAADPAAMPEDSLNVLLAMLVAGGE
jgi:AcrR family transcriptional regulator